MSRLCLTWVSILVALSSHVLCLQTEEGDQYGVIMDAGSSGTKLKVYKWQKPKLVTEVPSMELIPGGKKFTPTIGHFSKKPEGLSAYLEDIVKKAKESVPENLRASTPIYLMATAGARILDGKIALGLFNRIRNVLSNSTINPFRFSGKNVRILSGEEEAVFAWVALNALNGFFNSTKPATESLGLLEMGGGSTQIAFIPSEPLYAGEFQVFIGGRRFDLYVHSYLFFGLNYIKQRISNHLMSINAGSTVIHNPCRLVGDDIIVRSETGSKVNFIGDSNPQNCSSILRQFLTKATGDKCHPKPCAIGSVYQPRVGNTSFYATQGFVYTPQTMKSTGPNKLLNITQLQREANIYCSKSFADAKKSYNIKYDKYVSDECMTGLYFPMLILDSYQLDPDLNSITVSNKINSKRIDWTMGAMQYEVSMMFQSKRLMPLTNISCVPMVNSSVGQPTVSYRPVTDSKHPVRPVLNSASSFINFLETLLVCLIAVAMGTGH